MALGALYRFFAFFRLPLLHAGEGDAEELHFCTFRPPLHVGTTRGRQWSSAWCCFEWLLFREKREQEEERKRDRGREEENVRVVSRGSGACTV